MKYATAQFPIAGSKARTLLWYFYRDGTQYDDCEGIATVQYHPPRPTQSRQGIAIFAPMVDVSVKVVLALP